MESKTVEYKREYTDDIKYVNISRQGNRWFM